MFKPTFLNIILYWVVKYITFYIFLMFKGNNLKWLDINNIKNGEDLFYSLWLVLFLPVVCILIFSAPLYYSFKVKNTASFLLIVTAIGIAEYFMYVFFTSEKHIDMNGVYNGILSLLILLLFYFKPIIALTKH